MYEWLNNPYRRRNSLRLVHSAVARRWLSGPGHDRERAELCKRLADVLADPTTTPRELLRVGRIHATMARQGLAAQRAELRALEQSHRSEQP